MRFGSGSGNPLSQEGGQFRPGGVPPCPGLKTLGNRPQPLAELKIGIIRCRR